MQSNATIQSATFVEEPITILKDGTEVPYIPGTITNNREAYAASLHIVFNHVAEFHINMLNIISEKYNIPVDDMIQVVREDKRFTEMVVNPTIHTLGYFDPKDAESVLPPPPLTTQEVPQVPKKKRVIRIKRNPVA
jgi:hypothetical protein